MKKTNRVLTGLCVTSALLLAMPSFAQTNMEITVWHNENDNFGDTMRWWADEVNARTDGRVEITPVYNGALASVTETLDAVRDNVVPMGVALASFMSGVIPAMGYVEIIGGLPSDPEDTNRVLTELWPDLTAALKPHDVVPLWGQTAFGTGVVCRDRHLMSRDDWAGQTVRAAGRWQSRQVEAMGGSPVPIDTGEIYIALQNGNVNCALTNPTITAALRLYEVAPYYTNFNLPSNIVTYIVNKNVWEGLSEEDRGIITRASEEAMANGVTYIADKVEEQLAAIEAGGGDVRNASAEERQAFVDATMPVFDDVGAVSGEIGQAFQQKLSVYW